MSDNELAELRNETIGFVFQSFQLLPRTTAVDNVGLPLVYRGIRRSERRRLAVAALEAVSMGHRLDHHPAQMSGGEQQRVAIARALVGEPAVLLADEPTGNLDSRNGGDVLAILEQLNRDHGVAVVIVTHDHEVADQAPAADLRTGRPDRARHRRRGRVRLGEAFRVAFDALRANRLRSALTMLGVVIGVAAVVVCWSRSAPAPRTRSRARSRASAPT